MWLHFRSVFQYYTIWTIKTALSSLTCYYSLLYIELICILVQVKAESCGSAYFSAQVLIRYYNHIGWISDSCGSPSDVGEDYFRNQDMSGV